MSDSPPFESPPLTALTPEPASPSDPSEPSLDRELRRVRRLAEHPEILQAAVILDALPDIVFLLNEDLRVVASNRQFPRILKAPRLTPVGMRFGELVACAHAGENGKSCGHDRDCVSCGAFTALCSSRGGGQDAQECALLSSGVNRLEIVELRVETRPVVIAGERLSLLSAQDVTDERRRRAMEKLFFSESMAIADRLRANLDKLDEIAPQEIAEDVRLIQTMFHNMVEEIDAQKELLAAENDELQPRFAAHDAGEILAQVEAAYRSHDWAYDKRLRCQRESFTLVTDARLLRRILGNMTKNALEASHAGDEIVLACRQIVRNGEPRALFSVHNPGVMPRSVQLQVFNRSFSTKSTHRGLGTYSMKLLSTRYLGGDVRFESNAGAGTTFFAELPVFPAGRPAAPARPEGSGA